jgi:Rrf2 family protein
MFEISTKGDYGLLLLSTLADKMREGREFVSLKEIAREKKLSMSYLSQIIMPLKRAGIVDSREGRSGGYFLTKKPGEITLMKVLETLEGPISPVRCCGQKGLRQGQKCGSENICNVKSVWVQAKIVLAQFLQKKTLEDLMKK